MGSIGMSKGSILVECNLGGIIIRCSTRLVVGTGRRGGLGAAAVTVVGAGRAQCHVGETCRPHVNDPFDNNCLTRVRDDEGGVGEEVWRLGKRVMSICQDTKSDPASIFRMLRT
jgi:hypothetical protein